MKHKIELKEWEYQCGDACCQDWGTELSLNGESITAYAAFNLKDTLEKLFAKLNIEVEIIES